jgi:hydroxyacylglutathione hydrolase
VFFRQVLYRDLGCASYVVGDGGEAIVLDPRFDIDIYLDIAREEGLRISHVVDTHDHADHVSGRSRLVAATGAIAHRPARPQEPREEDLEPGDELKVGDVRVRALATPGHRPEHIVLAVIDDTRSPEPWMVLTGDSLLVGDLARPDLAVEPDVGARDLYASLRALLGLGDHVEVWPGHVGGSLCGGAGLSRKTSSTIGYERLNDPLLSLDEPTFVDVLTSSVPSRPPNVLHICTTNMRVDFEEPVEPRLLDPREVLAVLDADVTVLDARNPDAFDRAHIAGALNLPVSAPAVGTRAGWALRPQEPLLIAAHDEQDAQLMKRALQAVGLWNILGLTLDWDGLPLVSERSFGLKALADGLREHAVTLVDVREDNEWREGHVEGSIHLPLIELGSGRDLPAPQGPGPIAVACAAGARAAFAASLLRRGGWHEVVRVSDGGVGGLADLGISLVGGAN